MIKRLTKLDVVTNIAVLLDVDPPRMSTGSTEPREIFATVNDRLGLGIRSNATKQELARRIVESSGNVWQPDYESRGATVTLDGLIAVENAVRFFMGLPERAPMYASSAALSASTGVRDLAERRLQGVSIDDYLRPTAERLEANWLDLVDREWPSTGGRQAVFTPVETVLSLAASLRVRHSAFGSSTAHLAPSPVPELAELFKRPPSSMLAKMANLDGSRANGGKFDQTVAAELAGNLEALGEIYRQVLAAARRVGIERHALPDFLGCEFGGVPKRPIDY